MKITAIETIFVDRWYRATERGDPQVASCIVTCEAIRRGRSVARAERMRPSPSGRSSGGCSAEVARYIADVMERIVD